MAQRNIRVGNISDISGEVNIAAGDIYKGYTAEQVSILLTQITSTFQPKPFDGRSPYKGLDVFEEEDAELFFGREKLVADLVSRVETARAVFITGPSGSGKSSLVRAGLLYSLKQGAIKNLHSERWLYETLKPGRDPMGELARVISALAGTTNAGDEVRAKASTEEDILARWCEIALKEGRDKRAVLFIDQFEEVFTQISNETERQTFLQLLTHAATVENGRVMVLFAMRSDFVSNCATYPRLNELLNQQFIQIGAMQPDELVSAIAQPALRVGLRIDPDLVAQIINDMQGEPGALPLMQFALKDLFDSEQANGGMIALTLKDYLQRGGIRKSLERHADHSFAMLNKNEQELAGSIFSGLIEVGRGTQDTRRTALLDELIPADSEAKDVQSIIQKLADARLVTTDEQAGKDTVTISHEKLIDAWPWLKKLVNENREMIALQNEIASDAQEWNDHKQDPSYLYTGARLANVREQLEAKKLVFSGLARDFVLAGHARRRRGRVILIAAVSTIFALLVIAVIVFSTQSNANQQLAQQRADMAGTAQAHAEESQVQAKHALGRQLAAQAQSIYTTGNAKQMIAVLLAVQSMRISPSLEAIQVLQNNMLARSISDIVHDDAVLYVAFSPDGKYVASGSSDRTARVSEAETGREIARITHADKVNFVAFSPDGTYVVSGSADHTARVWEATTGKEIARMTHEDVVNAVAFSPDGQYVVSGSADHTARVWEATTGKETARMTHSNTVKAVAFSSDGQYVVSGSEDFTARVWETATGQEVARMTHDGGVNSVDISPDGQYVVSGSEDFTARVWETATGQEVARTTYGDVVSSVAFSPDSKYVASGNWEHTIGVLEVATGQEITILTQDSTVRSVAFSPDGMYIVAGGRDYTARVWEAATGKEVARMTHAAAVWAVAFSPDGKYVVSGSDDDHARVWEATSGQEITRMTHGSSVDGVAFSPDGKYIVSGSRDHTTRVWEAATGKETARMDNGSYIWTVAFSPDGKYVASGGCDQFENNGCTQGSLSVWEVATGKELSRMTHATLVASVAFSPDSKYLVSGSWDHTARVWETATGQEVSRLTHADEVRAVAFSPDGKYIVSGSLDRTVRMWEAATGQEVALMNHGGSVNAVAFSLDGRYVVSGSGDSTTRVWEVATAQEVMRMTHDSNVRAVAFSPDGQYVVSGSRDQTARVWEITTGKEITRIIQNTRLNAIAFSPDGKYIVSGSEDNFVRLWLWRPDDLLGKACSRVTRNLNPAEWIQYLGEQPYEAVCPNLPIELQPTPTATP